jgi:hypothetical protein
METAFALSNPMSMNEQVSYGIWAAVTTSTKAFGKVEIKVHGDIRRIFIKVHLRWWSKKLNKLHGAWMLRARERVKEFVPEGWRCLVYYVGINDEPDPVSESGE